MKKTFVSTAILFLFFLYNSYGQSAEDSYIRANEKCTEGNVKGIAHDYIGAISLYDEAVAIDPKYALTYYNRGIAKLNLADNKGACVDLKKAEELGYKKAEETIIKFCH